MESGDRRSLNPKVSLLDDLADPEYRRGFVEGHAKETIAFQLKLLRKAEGLDQKGVAELLGNRKLQPMISRYENPDYGRYSISTLLELAAAFDVALIVRFASFGELAEWDLKNPCNFHPTTFKDDESLNRLRATVMAEASLSPQIAANQVAMMAQATATNHQVAFANNAQPTDAQAAMRKIPASSAIKGSIDRDRGAAGRGSA